MAVPHRLTIELTYVLTIQLLDICQKKKSKAKSQRDIYTFMFPPALFTID